MAVMQTARGRVIGLIVQPDDQPKAQPVAKPEPEKQTAEKEAPARRAGRPAKK